MKTFYPRIYKDVEASYPHPKKTMYRVSIGEEEWNGSFVQVIKVQMVYDGIVAGRKSPSYPVGTDDYKRVSDEIHSLITRYEEQKQKVVCIPAKPSVTIPYSQYIALLLKIPHGYIVRESDIEAFFKDVYQTDSFRFNDAHRPIHTKGGESIPYWRVVGKGGRVTIGRSWADRENKVQLLNAEGVETEEFGNGLVRVSDYKRYLFDLTTVSAKEIVNTPDTDQTPWEALLEYIFEADHLQSIPDQLLIKMARMKPLPSQSTNTIYAREKIRQELQRRKLNL